MSEGAFRPVSPICVPTGAQLGITLRSALNRPFAEWGEVFPNASCVVALVDRLIHRAEVIEIDGESYRLKEAKEREAQRTTRRAAGRRPPRINGSGT